jgi:hypothetical protein
MSYAEKNFSGCVFNPLTKRKMLEAHPRLNEIISHEWLNETELDGLLRFMVMVYDPKSILVSTERDLNYRKSVAAELSGLNMNDEELMTSIYTFTHDFLAELVVRFLTRFVKSKEFAAIVIVENCFWESAKKLLEPISGKDSKAELEAVQKKSAIKDELDKDIARLDKYYKAFFGEDDDLEAKAKSRVTPESIARLK